MSAALVSNYSVGCLRMSWRVVDKAPALEIVRYLRDFLCIITRRTVKWSASHEVFVFSRGEVSCSARRMLIRLCWSRMDEAANFQHATSMPLTSAVQEYLD